MKLRTLLTIQAVLLGAFGLGTLLIPSQLWGMYGITMGAGGIFFARFGGALVVGTALLSWLVRNAAESEARNAIVTVFFFDWAAHLIVFVLAQLDGTANALGWSNVALGVVGTLAWAYFRFMKPSPATT